MPKPADPARTALAAANAKLREEEAQRARLQAAQERARDELADLDRRLIDATTAHAMAMKEAPRARALAYMADGGVEERPLPDEASQAVLDNLKSLHQRHAELAATLDSEMVSCQRRIELAQKAVTRTAAAAIEASPEFHALLDSVSAAWQRLRTLKVTLDSVIRLTKGNLPQEAYQLRDRSEPLDRRVGYEVDEQFVTAWEQAVERLGTDANARLPKS